MFEKMKKIALTVTACALLAMPVQAQTLLEKYDLEQVQEVRNVTKSISHKESLVNTINLFLKYPQDSV